MTGRGLIGRIGLDKRNGGVVAKKVLRPGHSHLLLWWWASKPEGALLGPSFRWPSYIWASYFTRTDSQQGPLGHSRGHYSLSLHGFQPLRRAARLLLFLRRNVANKWPGLTQRIWAYTPTSLSEGMEEEGLCGDVTVEKNVREMGQCMAAKTCSQGD